MFPAAGPPLSTIFAFNPEFYQPLLEFAQTAGIRAVQKSTSAHVGIFYQPC